MNDIGNYYSLKANYFDHNATTPVSEDVINAAPEFLRAWGNPSSIHWGGRQPKNILRDTRNTLAKHLHCSPLEIVFTSGGSESNNTIIKGVFDYYQSTKFLKPELARRTHYMCSEVEHPSVIKTMTHLQSLGARVDFIPVSRKGEIDLKFYRKHVTEETALVSVMYANNETGTIFPIQEMAKIAHEKGALFHTDSVQAFGKISVNLNELGVDFASFSGHKFYSVKGSGFFFTKKNSNFTSLIHGGGQERHRRGGTENVFGIACLGVMAEKLPEVAGHGAELEKLRDHMEARILSEITDATLTAGESPRLPNTSSLVIKGVDGETMLMSMDIKGYAVSTGAACSSGNPEPSPVLLAMGLSRQEAQNSLRVSLGWSNTLEQVDAFVDTLKAVVDRLRAIEAESEVNRHV
ncbi:cysteine desulfurase family protein [Bdellovibrio sp. HCB337]|uniref:cysteine desulfurase family protein n=1 Tax=Bdellovibrio sp. HCB337 TaxID=3394358 RepID=UPI0039A5CC40